MSRIVVYGEQAHPILSLVELNLRSKKKDYFNHLKNIASHHGLASLSAVQLGESYSIFVMLRKHFL